MTIAEAVRLGLSPEAWGVEFAGVTFALDYVRNYAQCDSSDGRAMFMSLGWAALTVTRDGFTYRCVVSANHGFHYDSVTRYREPCIVDYALPEAPQDAPEIPTPRRLW